MFARTSYEHSDVRESLATAHRIHVTLLSGSEEHHSAILSKCDGYQLVDLPLSVQIYHHLDEESTGSDRFNSQEHYQQAVHSCGGISGDFLK